MNNEDNKNIAAEEPVYEPRDAADVLLDPPEFPGPKMNSYDLTCFVCDKVCGSFSCDDNGNFAGYVNPNEATIWSAGGGNYGSRIWDFERGDLTCLICDGCLIERRGRCVTIWNRTETFHHIKNGMISSEELAKIKDDEHSE